MNNTHNGSRLTTFTGGPGGGARHAEELSGRRSACLTDAQLRPFAHIKIAATLGLLDPPIR